MKKFTGVMPALITPLNADETINVPVLKQQLADLMEEGADGFYIGGATGEGIALTAAARKVLAEEAVKFVNHRVPCIVHIASANFAEAIELAKHAEAVGADGISAIPPMFFAYDVDDVYNYYKAIAEAVNIPLIVYYNPAAGFNMNAGIAAKLFEIENVTGIKWTSSAYYGVVQLQNLTNGEMNIINGPDEMLLMGLSAGADGGIGSTYNVMMPLIKAIYENFKAGNRAEALACQKKADRIIAAILKWKVIPAIKVILNARGYKVGEAAFPMTRYTEEQKEQILTDMREAGLEI